jgi:hypothetical protein
VEVKESKLIDRWLKCLWMVWDDEKTRWRCAEDLLWWDVKDLLKRCLDVDGRWWRLVMEVEDGWPMELKKKLKKKTLDAQDVQDMFVDHQTQCAKARDASKSCCAHGRKALRMVEDEVRMMKRSCWWWWRRLMMMDEINDDEEGRPMMEEEMSKKTRWFLRSGVEERRKSWKGRKHRSLYTITPKKVSLAPQTSQQTWPPTSHSLAENVQNDHLVAVYIATEVPYDTKPMSTMPYCRPPLVSCCLLV